MVTRSRLAEAIIVLAFGASMGHLISKIETPTETSVNQFSQTEVVLCSPDARSEEHTSELQSH